MQAAAQFAVDHPAEDLLEVCISLAPRFLSKTPEQALIGVSPEVARSLLQAIPESGLPAFLFAQRWCEANGHAKDGFISEEVRAVLDCIKLQTLSTTDIVAIVRPSNLIPSAKLKEVYEERIKVRLAHIHAVAECPGMDSACCSHQASDLLHCR